MISFSQGSMKPLDQSWPLALRTTKNRPLSILIVLEHHSSIPIKSSASSFSLNGESKGNVTGMRSESGTVSMEMSSSYSSMKPLDQS